MEYLSSNTNTNHESCMNIVIWHVIEKSQIFKNTVNLVKYLWRKTPSNKNQSVCHEYLKKVHKKQRCHKTKSFNSFLIRKNMIVVARVQCRGDRPPPLIRYGMSIYSNIGRQGILVFYQWKKWNGSRHIILVTRNLTGLKDRVQRLVV